MPRRGDYKNQQSTLQSAEFSRRDYCRDDR